MDVVGFALRVRPIPFAPVNRRALGFSTRKCVTLRMRFEGGSRHSVGGQNEIVKRSEVVDLLLTALNTLLLPQNQTRLKERLQSSNRAKELSVQSVEVPFPPQIVEHGPGPSKATTDENSVEVLFSEPFSGKELSLLELSTAIGEVPAAEDPTAANDHPSPRVLMTTSEQQPLLEISSPLPHSIRQVYSSGTLKESGPGGMGDRVNEDIQRSSCTEETGLTSEDTALSTTRRLKVLNVHTYVHNALRESYLRSYLRSRKIEE